MTPLPQGTQVQPTAHLPKHAEQTGPTSSTRTKWTVHVKDTESGSVSSLRQERNSFRNSASAFNILHDWAYYCFSSIFIFVCLSNCITMQKKQKQTYYMLSCAFEDKVCNFCTTRSKKKLRKNKCLHKVLQSHDQRIESKT